MLGQLNVICLSYYKEKRSTANTWASFIRKEILQVLCFLIFYYNITVEKANTDVVRAQGGFQHFQGSPKLKYQLRVIN